MLHRADVQRATAAAAMQHARASQGERPYRQEAAYTPGRIRETITSGLKIYIAVRENKEREKERKEGREREKEREERKGESSYVKYEITKRRMNGGKKTKNYGKQSRQFDIL